LVPKFKPNYRWSCVSSELSWVEVSRLFLDQGTRNEVSRTTFLVSKCLVAEVPGNRHIRRTEAASLTTAEERIDSLSVSGRSEPPPCTGGVQQFGYDDRPVYSL